MNKLQQFLYTKVSPVTLAWLRIGTGLTLLAHMTGLTRVLNGGQFAVSFPQHMFADQAAYRLADGFRLAYPGLEWLPVPSFAGFGMLETLLLVLAVARTIGLLSRITGPLLFLGLAYMFGVSQFFYSHSLLLFVLTLGVLVWTRNSQYMSVDALILGTRRTPVSIYPIRLLQFLVTIIYVSVAGQRLAAGWHTGEIPALVAEQLGSGLLNQVASMLGGFGMLAIVSMILLPVIAICLWHRKLRRGAVIIGILVHIFAAQVVDMGAFHWQMIVLYIAFFTCLPQQCAVNFGQMQQQ